MRRTDIRPVYWNGLPVLCSKWPNPAVHLAQVEQRTTAHPSGDVSEEPISSWESAWIDLGGEG
jgi:hypothetical protein